MAGSQTLCSGDTKFYPWHCRTLSPLSVTLRHPSPPECDPKTPASWLWPQGALALLAWAALSLQAQALNCVLWSVMGKLNEILGGVAQYMFMCVGVIMCVCLCVHMCAFSICVYMCVPVHVCDCTYACASMFVCICVCLFMCVCAPVYTSSLCTCPCVCICLCVSLCLPVCIGSLSMYLCVPMCEYYGQGSGDTLAAPRYSVCDRHPKMMRLLRLHRGHQEGFLRVLSFCYAAPCVPKCSWDKPHDRSCWCIGRTGLKCHYGGHFRYGLKKVDFWSHFFRTEGDLNQFSVMVGCALSSLTPRTALSVLPFLHRPGLSHLFPSLVSSIRTTSKDTLIVASHSSPWTLQPHWGHRSTRMWCWPLERTSQSAVSACVRMAMRREGWERGPIGQGLLRRESLIKIYKSWKQNSNNNRNMHSVSSGGSAHLILYSQQDIPCLVISNSYLGIDHLNDNQDVIP